MFSCKRSEVICLFPPYRIFCSLISLKSVMSYALDDKFSRLYIHQMHLNKILLKSLTWLEMTLWLAEGNFIKDRLGSRSNVNVWKCVFITFFPGDYSHSSQGQLNEIDWSTAPHSCVISAYNLNVSPNVFFAVTF